MSKKNAQIIDQPKLPWDRIARVLALLFAATLLLGGGAFNWITSENRMLANSNNELVESNKDLEEQFQTLKSGISQLEHSLKEKQTQIEKLQQQLFDAKVQNASLRASLNRSAATDDLPRRK